MYEYLYGSEAITYLKAILLVVTVSIFRHQTFPTPYYSSPSALCMAAEPSPIWNFRIRRELQYG
jgi:hypothetical protein